MPVVIEPEIEAFVKKLPLARLATADAEGSVFEGASVEHIVMIDGNGNVVESRTDNRPHSVETSELI